MISKLTAEISDTAGPQGSVSVWWIGVDGTEQRQQYGYSINILGETLDSGTDLRSGSGDAIDHAAMLGTVLAFLESDAEKIEFRRPWTDLLFSPGTAEWAYGVSDELTMARMELEHDTDS